MIKTTLARQFAVIERYKAEARIVGEDYVPKNAGARRTESKRALLAEIHRNDYGVDREAKFKADF